MSIDDKANGNISFATKEIKLKRNSAELKEKEKDKAKESGAKKVIGEKNYVRRPRLIPRKLLETVGRGVSLVKEGRIEEEYEKAEREIQKEDPRTATKVNDETSSNAPGDDESTNEIFGGRAEYQVVYKAREESRPKLKTQYNANFDFANEIKTSPSNSVVVRPRGGGSEDFFDTARIEKLQQLAEKAEKEKTSFEQKQESGQKSTNLRNSQDGPRLQFGFQPLQEDVKNQDQILGGVKREESRSRGSVWRDQLAAKLTSTGDWDEEEHSLPWGSTSSSLPPSSPSSSSTSASSSPILSDFIEELDTLQAPGGVRQPRASPRSSPNLPSHLSPLSPAKKFNPQFFPSSPLPTAVWSHQQDLKSNKQFLGVFDTRPYFYIPPPNLRGVEQKVYPRRDSTQQKLPQNRRSDKPPPHQREQNIFAKIVNFWTDTSHVQE